MMKYFFILLVSLFSLQSKADPVNFAERLETYRQMTELFRQVCMTQPPIDPATGIGQFAENVIFTNVNFTPDDGSIDCNANLRALTRLHQDLEAEAGQMENSGEIAECNVPEVLSAQGQDDAEAATVAAGEAEMATGCEANLTTENLCLDRFTCSFTSAMGAFMRARDTDLQFPSGAPIRPDGGSCQGVGGLAISCAFSTVQGIFDSVGNFMSAIGGLLNWSVDKASRITANLEAGIATIAEADETTINQVDILTEADQHVIDSFMRFRDASPSGKLQMLRNLGVNIWNGINTAIKESYGCVRWEGEPYASDCLQPMDNFCNAPCEQKVDAVCGIYGYISTDIIIGAFTGGVISKIGSMAANVISRAGGAAFRTLGKLGMEIPGVPSLVRRLNRIRRLARVDIRLARRFAVIQARQILALPVSRAIRQGGAAFLQRVGPGVDRAAKQFITSARLVGAPPRWVASALYAPIKSYMTLARNYHALGGRVATGGSVMVIEAVDGAQTIITANLLEARPIDLPPNHVRTLVHYTDHNRYGDPIPRNRWVVSSLDPAEIESTNLFGVRVRTPVAAAAPGPVLAPRPAVSAAIQTTTNVSDEVSEVVVTGTRLTPAQIAERNLIYGETAPTPVRTSDQIIAQIGDSPYNQAIARAAVDELRLPGDFRDQLDNIQAAWRDANPNAPPALRVDYFEDLPPAEQLRRLNDLEGALRIGNPQVIERAGLREVRIEIEQRIRVADAAVPPLTRRNPSSTEPPPRPFDPTLESRVTNTAAELDAALSELPGEISVLSREIDEMGVDQFLTLRAANASDELRDRIRLLHIRLANDRLALSVQGRVPPPIAAQGSELPSLEDIVETYGPRITTVPEQNRTFIARARGPWRPGTFFVDSQNRMLKWLNDHLKDKGNIDALGNRHNAMILEAVERLRLRYPTLRVSPYSDYKGLRLFVSGPPGQELRLMNEFREAMEEVDLRFMNELRDGNYVNEAATATRWFCTGIACSADEANIQARFPPGTTIEQIETAWRGVDTLRENLQSRFGNTSLMTRVNGTNKSVLKAEVIEVIRKNADNADVMRVLNARHRTQLTAADVAEMRAYFDSIDNFSPGLLLESRVVHQFDDAEFGGLTIDFTGVGSVNAEATMMGLARGDTLTRSISEIREAEVRVTRDLDALKESSENVITEVLERHGIDRRVTVSGDDMVVVPSAPITQEIRREIVLAQARANVPSSMRISFFERGIVNPSHRSIIATQGESIEKALRKRLEGVLTQRELRDLTFATDMRGTLPGTGGVNLITNNSLSAQRLALVQREFSASVESVNAASRTQFTVLP